MKQLISILIILLFISCKNKEKPESTTISENNAQLKTEHPGKKLMETHCYVCHNAEAPESNGRIAPPMVAIKAHYLDAYTSKEDFVKAVVTFTEEPTEENAILFGAVRRFGVMPKQVFPEGSIEKIAEYLYDYQIEEPEWFKDHIKEKEFKNYNQGQNASTLNKTQKSVEDMGLEYAISTKKTLGENLMSTIQSKGTLAALEFCNINAIRLTDSMSIKYNAKIKRASDQFRNANNEANPKELEYIVHYKKEVALNNDIEPEIVNKGDKIQFYYPIITNNMCLQCHGSKKDIQPKVAEKILKLYPHDLATGYKENQVRGVWSIEFNTQ